MEEINKNAGFALRYAFPRTIPVMVGYLFLGAAYGISMLGKFRDMKRWKPYLIFSLTDETFSVLGGEEGAGVCGISWKDPALCDDRAFGGILPETCELSKKPFWTAGNTGGGCHRGSPLVERQFPFKHWGRNRVLYDSGTDSIYMNRDCQKTCACGSIHR